MNSKILLFSAATIIGVGLAGCSAFYSPFSFPTTEASIESGRQAFVDQHCHQCHSVSGVRPPELAGASATVL